MSHSMFGTRGQMRWHSRPPKKSVVIHNLREKAQAFADDAAKMKAERDYVRKQLERERAISLFSRVKARVRSFFGA